MPLFGRERRHHGVDPIGRGRPRAQPIGQRRYRRRLKNIDKGDVDAKRILEQMRQARRAQAVAAELEKAFVNGDHLEAEHTGVSHHRVKPGKRQGFAHKHDQAEEVYVVLKGSGRIKLDDEIVELGRWDALRVPPGLMRGMEAGDEGAEVLAFGAPNTENGDVEMVRDWWTDE